MRHFVKQIRFINGEMSMNTVMLAVAPVPKISAGIPFDYSPGHIAGEVIACACEGAVIAHLHVLDEYGNETTDLSVFDETLRLIRKESDIIIQGSTGGSPDLPLSDRSVSLEHPLVQTASLNMGSINFGDSVYLNPLPDIREFANRMRERQILAEMEIFDLSMLYVGLDFAEKQLVLPHFNFCFGFENALPAQEAVLRFMLEQLAEESGAIVGVLHNNGVDFSFLRLALNLGVDIVRTGFEDSTMGSESNAILTAGLRRQAELSGRPIADIAEAKKRLGVMEQSKMKEGK